MTELLGEIVRDDDGASVVFERHYRTTAEDLWDAVTSPERLARWFAPVNGDLRVGGRFVIAFDDADAPQCQVVSCDPPTGFAWSWPHDDRSSLVEVSVSGSDEGSVLVLRHSRLSATTAPEYGAGWQAYVLSLAAHVEDGAPRDWSDDFTAARAGYAARA